jgi:hypothetical protein
MSDTTSATVREVLHEAVKGSSDGKSTLSQPVRGGDAEQGRDLAVDGFERQGARTPLATIRRVLDADPGAFGVGLLPVTARPRLGVRLGGVVRRRSASAAGS